MARDRYDNLICPIPGCGHVVQALTGLQELTKLQQHMRKKHKTSWSMHDALENRASIESMPQIPEDKKCTS